MFLWIRDQKLLAPIAIACFLFLTFGGVDLIRLGAISLIATTLLCAAVALTRFSPIASIVTANVAVLLATFLGNGLQASQIDASVVLLLLAAFANTKTRWSAFIANNAVSLISLGYLSFAPNVETNFNGVAFGSDQGRITFFIIGAVAVLSFNATAWFVGRLLITRITHVGSSLDRAFLEREVASTQLELAEQDRRFNIARDINELLLQELSTTITLAQSAPYVLKSQPDAAERIIGDIAKGTLAAHEHIRQLDDLLQVQLANQLALPNLENLGPLVVAFREFGFEVVYRIQGEPFKLDNGAQLVLYRIVFEALENVRRHAVAGTAIDIDFSWQDSHLQVLVKDNGEEQRNRANGELGEYSFAEDLEALTDRPTGAGLTEMVERAKLYGGTVEFARVPGVGFTVSAIFPDIHKFKA
jgi:signal transduction histidine kinase